MHYWLLAAPALLAFLTWVVLLGDTLETLKRWWGYLPAEDKEIVAIRARLEPHPWTANLPEEQRDQAFLLVELRNNGERPKLLKRARLRVSGKKAAAGPGGRFGRCVLSDEPNRNPPIVLNAGQTQWVAVSPSVRLPGIHEWFTPERLSRITVMEPEASGIHELAQVDEFNTAVSQRFGDDAKVVVELFDGGDRRLKSLSFPLAHGKDLFATDGSLMHDVFIAHWISWQRGTPPDSAPDCPS